MVVTTENRRPIQQLNDDTIGHIAAGEVVERPAQVVKELVENSIDAGAVHVRVEIDRGGFDRIAVIDDGGGIPSHELELAVTRHATSKLSSAQDLSAIHTLGFRGEALASIGMVSQLSVASRVPEAEGMKITVNDGQKNDLEAAGIAPGTFIEVRDLFANIPARLSFQKRPSTETATIVDIVVAQALCNPTVGFAVSVDGRSVLDTPPSTKMEDRLFDLLGAPAERLVPLSASTEDAEAPGDERWHGWISPPDLTRSKGDAIHIIINGRPVGSTPFMQAIRRGYHTRLMVGRHPICVVCLELPPDEIDVNVHPTKREVRLQHSWRVLERLERAIKHTLLSIPTGSMTPDDSPIGSIEYDADSPVSTPSSLPAWAKPAQARITYAGPPQEVNKTQTVVVSESPLTQSTLPNLGIGDTSPALSSAERDLHRWCIGHESVSPLSEPESSPLETEMTDVPEMVPLSQFADSYILAQGGDELFIIDQHALHERIRYERLRHDMASWASQSLMAPLELHLSASKQEILRNHLPRLAEIGFTFEIENHPALTAVPLILLGSERIEGFIDDVLAELEHGAHRLDTVESLSDEVAFMKSCRGAVKANQPLSLPEMRRLISDMRTISNPWACVHGRPTVLRMSLDKLDGHFGRHG
ncbi:MAG: DNA mismatch repair endonuclease MutL [Candidatus Thalassarchaeaceae archaeon]|jgi:DNA mismatch repair protein MutL|nr:DNA mismatch repair endonuclease MutL [Candidatus Thalassarchaeaceae archaeon]